MTVGTGSGGSALAVSVFVHKYTIKAKIPSFDYLDFHRKVKWVEEEGGGDRPPDADAVGYAIFVQTKLQILRRYRWFSIIGVENPVRSKHVRRN